MGAAERIRYIRLMEKMEKNKKFSEKIGIYQELREIKGEQKNETRGSGFGNELFSEGTCRQAVNLQNGDH